MQHEIDVLAGVMASADIANVTTNEMEMIPRCGTDQRLNLIQIALMAGGKIIQAHDGLVEPQQCFNQIGTDESRGARHQPTMTIGFERVDYLIE